MSGPISRRGDISRRRFLQGASLGAVAVGVTAYGGSRVQGQSPSPSASPPPPDPLLAGDLTKVTETWVEPEVWRPAGTDQLSLHVVENQGGFRFSWGGQSPGPTIRMRGDQTLYVRIQNDLGPDDGATPIGPSPDPKEGFPGPEGAMLATLQGDERYGEGLNRIPTIPQPDWSLGEHLNGVHSQHVTNMHSHGLHVAPGKNDNGTSSDDIYLRITPAADAIKISQNPGLYAAYQENRDEIIDEVADFEFRLGNVMEGLVAADGQVVGSGVPHPPGTYWYHPHSHGSTQNQVASGMAGFLIIEGDVDALVNERIAGDPDAQWDQKTGDYDYRERDLLVQRVFVAPTENISGANAGEDTDDPQQLKRGSGSGGGNRIEHLVNGSVEPGIITMRPGAVERWRVLNGSVDGSGFMRFAVLAGEFTVNPGSVTQASGNFTADAGNVLQRVDRTSGSPVMQPLTVQDWSPITVSVDGTDEPVEKAKIWQLSWDGITRVVADGAGDWKYKVRDLAAVNDGQEPDFDSLVDCFEPENLQRCYWRPNELRLAPANRGDVFFKAPKLEDGETAAVYTLVALPTQIPRTETQSKIMAHVVVSGDPVPGGDDLRFDALLDGLAVHPYELPVTDDELLVTDEERAARGLGDGELYRTRVIDYAGWGANGLPIIQPNPEYLDANPEKERLTYYVPPSPDSTEYTVPVMKDGKPVMIDGEPQGVPVTNIRRFPSGDLPTVLLPALTRSMNIDGEKFYPTSPSTPKMLLNTAEEWAVINQSIDLYSVAGPDSSWTTDQLAQYLELNPELVYYQFDYVDTPPDGALTSPQPYWLTHVVAYAMTMAQVAAVNAKRPTGGDEPWAQRGQIGNHGPGANHPFHIHQNPFWITRIDVPDKNGDYVNVLQEPMWSDTVALPKSGGRVVFRSRFVDYQGEFVEHCHLLLHEDNGMMQRLQIITDAGEADYQPSAAVTSSDATVADVNALYPQPTADEMYESSLFFVDQNNTGQVYPGADFVVKIPTPPTE
jgi:FtsP/CotA-like multicopper oxidase with cupredoxin domain